MKEEYKKIIKFPDFEISNFGIVRNIKTGKIKKGVFQYTKTGAKWRQRVQLTNEYGVSNHTIHKLVMNAFSKNLENKPTIDHIDRDPFNNRLDNLRWATHKEQMDNKAGFRLSVNKIHIKDLENILAEGSKVNIKEISEIYNLSPRVLKLLIRYVKI